MNIKNILAAALLFGCGTANASTINFDDQGLIGPSTFGAAAVETLNLTIDGVDVQISGGGLLTNVNNLPSNSTSVYGTANTFVGALNPITITFGEAITFFSVGVFNGSVTEVDYRLSDNLGSFSQMTVDSNANSGSTVFGFGPIGSIIEIAAVVPAIGSSFNFFIDNITFDALLPPDVNPVPLPAALPLMAGGLGLLGFLSRCKKQQTTA